MSRVEVVGKIDETYYGYSVLDVIYKGYVDMVINTAAKKKSATNDGFKIRRAASENCLFNIVRHNKCVIKSVRINFI